MFSPMREYDYDGYPRRRYHQQVPAFGSWECFQDVDDLSHCFEAARQAGYIRYAADRDLYVTGDLYEDHVVTPTMIVVPRPMAKAGLDDTDDDNHRKEEDKEKSWMSSGDYDGDGADRRRNPKPVDEDLYKISPQLLHSIKPNNYRRTRNMKKKGLWRLFTSCLVPCYSSS